MLEAIHLLRRGIIAKLTDAITLNGSIVPVYSRIPTDAVYPMIRVYGVSTNEIDENQTSFITETTTRIECITSFYSDDGGELDVNLMVSQCLNLIRTRSSGYVDLSLNGFKVFTSVNEGVKYLQDDLSDYTYFRAIIEISNKIEQINYIEGYTNRIAFDGGVLESLGCIPSDLFYDAM